MTSHSYLVHFELIQTCCLVSHVVHIRYLDHSRTRHQTLFVKQDNHAKACLPLKEKEMKEVSYHAHGSSFKKK